MLFNSQEFVFRTRGYMKTGKIEENASLHLAFAAARSRSSHPDVVRSRLTY
jgi:hypothetical protein